ncbi:MULTISPECIES: DNA repair protein RecN [Photorhabdus]|uniref:DNA repair protein RecN n=1 Tax=Photorhabdus laumondii subsp. laumondii (strain DSM 15139 / CIP 105565 / TT01) TaxID=243265 RepID=Q7N1U5_PHOLL|nr:MULTISPECIES: DNA repair protein RecN [Photorhabdus]AWK43048.1 DNA repair protein RecN [Photorhabdus laumondii subsp. laumondii]AXG43812.1 DNA repair protein RecN [Photorhabdus laumondii subsp. laumondii]AXG48361.1 DNA repair protein RecN [Photorhabdus laumondii subsp. laumondii]KTL61389.1 DNA repair protein RecN [Photorhabdus laumondii subsp. laumondii]MCC8390258.1 DNA repair protein RecN [Photorhabdus laumondii]
MLTQLTISNFAIVRELEIDFQPGMTAITGETGAGKSIAIDALGLCLGNRGEANMVRRGASRADICARFSLSDTPSARQWLEAHQLDDSNECLLRRTITSDGRSRGFINGTAVPISQLRELGTHLIQIHGQHAHQLLLNNGHQKRLLDTYANQFNLQNEMKQAYQQWHQSCQDLARFQQQALERQSRQQLLEYHLKELNELAPQPGEYPEQDNEYKRLANRGQLLSVSQTALQLLSDNDEQNIISLLNYAKHELAELITMDDKFSQLLTMLEEASIQINEVSDELRHYGDQLDMDPNRLFELEQKISQQIRVARKHHVPPEELPSLHQQLLEEQQLLAQQEDDCTHLSEQVNKHHKQALEVAERLHLVRQQYAKELSELITHSMHQLAMPHGRFTIDVSFTPEHLNADGSDKVEFNVTTNPGQPHQSLAKVASGGELSRIALAIQVITAKKMETSALIFDEVDVGISGPTAAIVGRLLRELGESTQVMCVTHLPQVAGCGHQHFYVSKQTDGEETETQMQLLDKKARLQELARLLAGSEVTKNTLANAKELLAA